MSGWTDERVSAAKKLWDDGCSASVIADELGQGVTRNAVLGMIHRNGWSGRIKGQHHKTRYETRPLQARKPRPAPQPPPRTKPLNNGTLASYFAPTQRKLRPEPAEAQPIRVTITELTESSCRWPLGDPSDLDTFRYCGARVDLPGIVPYCAGHCRMAYARAA